eukprot:scpid82231/ scgid3442/ Putative glycerol kinase 5; ATP:glycerol 3-phosphotransferase 5
MASDSTTPTAGNENDIYVVSVDIGSTTMRCFIVDADAKFIAVAVQPIEYLRPQHGYVELDPEVIWNQFVQVVKDAMKKAGISVSQVSSMGISLARGTFTSWHRDTGEIFHPLISWQDTRATEVAKAMNKGSMFRTLSAGSRFLHTVTRDKRFLAAAVIEFKSMHMCIRANWVLNNMPGIKELAEQDKLLMGTLDTFLLWRLSNGKVFATDCSNASATAFYDPFTLGWSSISCQLMGLPITALPTVVHTSGHICTSEESIFGGPIEVHCVVADQQAAAFGQMCWDPLQVKCTLGTGSFLDVVTHAPHASATGNP